ncbi:hypothetical protein ACFTY8_48095 [Streptomyces mirabilis]|uniref:hypothetical protein n=1 Tax=Streptomyces mirabilis TaxID=68239 RepID=UPI00362CEE48
MARYGLIGGRGAEAGVLSAARLATGANLVAVAAVRFPKPTEPAVARVVPPCGLCRAAYRTHPANPAGIGPFPLFV